MSEAFEKRPAEELYDLRKDPFQLKNVAGNAEYGEIKQQLSDQLSAHLSGTGDPRETGKEMKWMGATYFSDRHKNPTPSERAREIFGLKKKYSYVEKNQNVSYYEDKL